MQGSPPNAADCSSLYILPQESESLRKIVAGGRSGDAVDQPQKISQLQQLKQSSEPLSAGVPVNQLRPNKNVKVNSGLARAKAGVGNLTARGVKNPTMTSAAHGSSLTYHSPVQTTAKDRSKIDENFFYPSGKRKYHETHDSIKI